MLIKCVAQSICFVVFFQSCQCNFLVIDNVDITITRDLSQVTITYDSLIYYPLHEKHVAWRVHY